MNYIRDKSRFWGKKLIQRWKNAKILVKIYESCLNHILRIIRWWAAELIRNCKLFSLFLSLIALRDFKLSSQEIRSLWQTSENFSWKLRNCFINLSRKMQRSLKKWSYQVFSKEKILFRMLLWVRFAKITKRSLKK